MPLTKKRLLAITDTCTFDYAGESVTVEYFVQRVLGVSDETLDAIKQEAEALPPGDTAAAYAFMARVWQRFFTAWDVTDGEGDDGIGAPIPLTDGAALYEMDPGLVLWLRALIACREAAAQGKPDGTTPPAPGDATSEPADGATSSTAASSRTRSRSRRSRSTSGAHPGSSSPILNGSTP